MKRWSAPSLGLCALLFVASLDATQLAAQQAFVSTHWHATSVLPRAFGETGWGGALGLTKGLYQDARLVAGLGFDVSWSGPSLSGARVPGTPVRRSLVAADVHLRRNIGTFGGGVGLEVGLPVGAVRSKVAEGSAIPAGGTMPAVDASGTEIGPAAGVLAALRVPLGRSASLLMESKVLHTWIYRGRHWLEFHRLGLAIRF